MAYQATLSPLRAFSIEFHTCVTEGCRPSLYDFVMRDNHSSVHMIADFENGDQPHSRPVTFKGSSTD